MWSEIVLSLDSMTPLLASSFNPLGIVKICPSIMSGMIIAVTLKALKAKAAKAVRNTNPYLLIACIIISDVDGTFCKC